MEKISGFKKISAVILTFLFLFSLTRPYARADENSAAGRKVLEQCQNGLVSLKIVAKVRMIAGGKEQFNKEIEAVSTATVIDPSGLAVTSASAVNPGETMEKMMKNISAKAGQGNMDVTFNVELSSISMVLPDGKEVPAGVVLRDKDLDLAFLRPTKKLGVPVFAFDLSQAGSANVLDPVVILDLLPKEYYGRKPIAALDRITAVVEKPMKFYVLNNQSSNQLGVPALGLDGKIVGITVVQIPNAAPVGTALEQMLGRMSDTSGGLTVIIPAADILEEVKQIPAAETK
jgi:hypothetical protein